MFNAGARHVWHRLCIVCDAVSMNRDLDVDISPCTRYVVIRTVLYNIGFTFQCLIPATVTSPLKYPSVEYT